MTGEPRLLVASRGNVNEDVALSSRIGELIISSREGIGSLEDNAISADPCHLAMERKIRTSLGASFAERVPVSAPIYGSRSPHSQ